MLIEPLVVGTIAMFEVTVASEACRASEAPTNQIAYRTALDDSGRLARVRRAAGR